MQHIINIFVGEELISFRDIFASTFRKLHPHFDAVLHSSLSLTRDESGALRFVPDIQGDPMDNAVVDESAMPNGLVNYFEDLYSRKVTVANPGNHSVVVMIWAMLFNDNVFGLIERLVEKINRCDANFHVEVMGFTHQAVNCFVPDPTLQLAPEVYKDNFDANIENLRKIREKVSAMRLIANRNIDNVALNLNEEGMARICAEYAALMNEHYLSLHPTVLNSREQPFESFGMSSILFDVDYYRTYIRNRILIDKIADQGVEEKKFSINALARYSNPILSDARQEIKQFYDKEVANVKAQLDLEGSATSSNIVGTVNSEINQLVGKLKMRVDDLLTSAKMNLFESEALLALILGEDSSMFESSAVGADEIILDDIIDESSKFFIELDDESSQLTDVSQQEIKDIRNRMRNIAVANRNRENRLGKINFQKNEVDAINKHLEGDNYNFEGTSYNVNLRIDTEPLEESYVPHTVSISSVDLRSNFGPVRNQGNQGSCASFAVSSVIEALSKGSRRYSPAFLYWVARDAQGSVKDDSGASLYAVIKAATQKGVCVEEEMPYNPDSYVLQPSDAAFNDALKCKVVMAKTVEPRVSDIKSALAEGFPVIVAAEIFDSFSDTNSGFVRLPSDEEVESGRSDRHATHALVVCGFSDNEKVFVVRNSWGTGFGVNGYCYIPYSYAEKYFKQACIITELSTTFELLNSKGVINFNLNDRKTEGAILENLISEDNVQLGELAAESDRLKSDWTQNIAVLGNVNNQTSIIKKYKDKLDTKIWEENNVIRDLQDAAPGKLKEFKKNYIIWLLYIALGMLISWSFTYFFYDVSWVWIVSLVATLIFVSVLGAYSYQWRKYRQKLRDEINSHAEIVAAIRQKKRSIDIKAHIHGSILNRIEEYRTWLLSEYHRLQLFNSKLSILFDEATELQQSMTPSVSYPFLSVLENPLLDSYYNTWKEKMEKSLDWKSIFNSFTMESELSELITENRSLNDAVMRGIQKFSMKEYVAVSNPGRWQFLPDDSRMSEVIPDLDYRAKTFSPYKPQSEDMEEKYIFIKDINHDDMNEVMRYFSKAPMPIATSDPYSISVLNIVRFNL